MVPIFFIVPKLMIFIPFSLQPLFFPLVCLRMTLQFLFGNGFLQFCESIFYIIIHYRLPFFVLLIQFFNQLLLSLLEFVNFGVETLCLLLNFCFLYLFFRYFINLYFFFVGYSAIISLLILVYLTIFGHMLIFIMLSSLLLL